MALPLPPTLLKLRQSVGIRVGLATSGSLSLSMQDLVDEYLNKCQREIFLRATWARQVIDVVIPLIQAQRDYDVPAEAGSIGGVQRLDVQDNKGTRWELRYEDALWVENNITFTNTPSRPTTWQYINDVIRITPAPDAATWPQINCRLIRDDAPLIVQTDRTSVDGEALVQYATIGVKEYMQVGGDQTKARAEFSQYLIDLRSASVGPGRMFNIATERLTGVPYWHLAPLNGMNMPFDTSWNPWAF